MIVWLLGDRGERHRYSARHTNFLREYPVLGSPVSPVQNRFAAVRADFEPHFR